jgi:hypothetical protein
LLHWLASCKLLQCRRVLALQLLLAPYRLLSLPLLRLLQGLHHLLVLVLLLLQQASPPLPLVVVQVAAAVVVLLLAVNLT